jgi:Cd2+/Zn2+-exporting ATPase
MKRKQKRKLIRIIAALVLFFAALIPDLIFGWESLIPNQNFAWLLPFGIYFAIYILISYDILRKTWLDIIHGNFFNEAFLMTVASIGAFALKEFKEGCAVLLFYQVGEWLQDYAVGRSRKSISSLMDIRPDFANLINEEGSVDTVDPELVDVGNIILVNPGEKIPLDGIIIEGSSSLDTKALTGESLPREVSKNDEVLSGTINLTSQIMIKVTKAFYDSTASKILDLVENAATVKSKQENFITKFAKVYTPIVVFSALGLALIPSIINGFITNDWSFNAEYGWYTWIQRALNFLVVSCPCALVISIPLSFFAGIGTASKEGILIKGSAYLEAFDKANTFIFDKTGTLTKGNFAVTKVYPEDKKEEILKLAATAEHNSSHPIAMSIVKQYGKEVEGGYTLTNVAGKGVIASKENSVIYAGNAKLLRENSIIFKEVDEAGTVVYIAKNNEFIGYILIEDEIKDDAKETLIYLHDNDFKTIMLTGDNEKIASSVAKELLLSDYKAQLLPQDKVNEVEKILNNKSKDDIVCFVGDGINDAPVLMRSDIGIAMGGVGSDAAIEASDLVLMHDDLKSLIKAKKISRKTIMISKENIAFAIGVKVAILILSALGIANIWIAIFGDVGVALLCIINAMRCSKIK